MRRSHHTAPGVLAYPLRCSIAFTPAITQTPPGKYGFCYGVAGNPRADHVTRTFVLGPSSPAGSITSYVVNHLRE